MKNTKRCVNIYFAGVQKSGDEETKTEFCTKGEFYSKNGAYYVTYEDKSDEAAKRARIFLKIAKDGATMRRMGEMNTVMEFSEGNMTDFEYKTPFGKLDMRINTKKTSNNLSEKGGNLTLEYTIYMGGESTEAKISLDID